MLATWEVGNIADRRRLELATRSLDVKGTTNDNDLAEFGVRVTTDGTVQGRGVVATRRFQPNQYIIVSQPKISLNSSVTGHSADAHTFRVETKKGCQLKRFEDVCLDYSSSQDSDFVRYLNSSVGTNVPPNVRLYQGARGMMFVQAIRAIGVGEELLGRYTIE